MNHFDDRASYVAYLREQGQLIQILDNNAQQDRSLCSFGPSVSYSPGNGFRPLVMAHDFQQVI